MAAAFYRRFGPILCVLALAAMPLLWLAARASFQSNANNVLDWLPASFDETARLVWFAERFGSDEILMVSWPGCTLRDPRLERLAARLRVAVSVAAERPAQLLFRRVLTGRQVLDELCGPPLELPRRQALARMQGWLVGGDGETTGAVALVSAAGGADRRAAVDAIYAAATATGLRRDQIYVAGPTADGAAIDRASQQWMPQMITLSACCSLLVAWWCLRHWRLVGIVFFAASFAWGMSLTVLYLSGVNMDAVLLMMPGLVFVLGISGAIHLNHYYANATAESGVADAPLQAITWGWLPCALAAGTTAVGLGSLALSQVTPVARFGVFSAIGVLGALATLLLLWPSAMLWWVPRGVTAGGAHDSAARTGRTVVAWWQSLFALATGRSTVLVVCAALAIPPFAYGVWRIDTSARLEDLLSPRSDLIRSYSWLQVNIGPLVPVEIVLRFKSGGPTDGRTLLRRAELVERLRRDLDRWPTLGGTIAATTFAPVLPTGRGARQVVQRRLLAIRLRQQWEEFVQLRYVCDDTETDEQLWRISTRTKALHGVDYGLLLSRLEKAVSAALAAERVEHDVQVGKEICGAVPLIFMAQQQLLRDLIKSFLAAFALIAVIMTLVMRSLAAGVLAMVPNAFPVLVVFGTMGLSGTTIDIGAMMTASAALGIAVDDTLHFLVWFRRGLHRGLGRREAIRYAYQSCATAMLQTSLICGLGLLVFVLSPFTPTAQFGWLMALLLLAALVGDLVLLPAMLASPLGKLFRPARFASGA